jgi:membrane-associated HD superfamily phosphohydrolase
MNVTTPNTIYPINMFDNASTNQLREENQAKNIIPEVDQADATNTQTRDDAQTSAATQGSAVQGEAENGLEATAEKAQEQQDQAVVEKLKARDREVRAHELAHASVGGQYAGAPSYEYQQGPDGRRYAVGGEVQIDIGKEASPEDTLQKMQQVIASAMAPQEPSAQDIRVANQARQIAAEARAEMNAERMSPETTSEDGEVEFTVRSQPIMQLDRESLQQREALASEAVSEAVGLASDATPVSQAVGLASEAEPVSASMGLATESKPVSDPIATRYGLNSNTMTGINFSQRT